MNKLSYSFFALALVVTSGCAGGTSSNKDYISNAPAAVQQDSAAATIDSESIGINPGDPESLGR